APLAAPPLRRLLPRRRWAVVLSAVVFGSAAPVGVCGVIPLARRLGAKGLPAYAATTFILAAPVVNPVVLLSTAFAFQGNWTIVCLRMAMTLSVAIVVGLGASTLSAGLSSPVHSPGLDAHSAEAAPGLRSLISLATAEFFDVIFFIILGALFTAVAQTFVPRGDLTALGSRPALSVLALMPVATLLSICSEADAFVARAFSTTFSTGAILAFMTIGQIVDLRNGFLLFRTLGGRLTALVILLSYVLVFAQGWLINAASAGP